MLGKRDVQEEMIMVDPKICYLKKNGTMYQENAAMVKGSESNNLATNTALSPLPGERNTSQGQRENWTLSLEMHRTDWKREDSNYGQRSANI